MTYKFDELFLYLFEYRYLENCAPFIVLTDTKRIYTYKHTRPKINFSKMSFSLSTPSETCRKKPQSEVEMPTFHLSQQRIILYENAQKQKIVIKLADK